MGVAGTTATANGYFCANCVMVAAGQVATSAGAWYACSNSATSCVGSAVTQGERAGVAGYFCPGATAGLDCCSGGGGNSGGGGGSPNAASGAPSWKTQGSTIIMVAMGSS